MTTQSRFAALIAVFLVFYSASALSAIIGTNIPAEPITKARIAALPGEQQPAWRAYLDKSTRQMNADREFFRDEMKSHHIKVPTVPPPAKNVGGISLDEPDAWYGGPEAARIADIIVSYQTPAGGWSKNLDMSIHLRAPGESFGTDNNSKHLQKVDYDQPEDPAWHYIGTFDNDATITQLEFLAKVISASHDKSKAWKAAFFRGLEYAFNSQYPTGGWPQVWPLEGGYHDAITVNDDAMLHVLQLMRNVSLGAGEYAFVPGETRSRCAVRFQRGLDCMLAMQITANGRKTVWCQQHDPITLKPASARNYEMPAQASSESAEIVLFSMQMPNPSKQIIESVHAAAAWFLKTEISGKAYKSTGPTGRHLVNAPDDSKIWARYYEVGTDRPVFGDRDLTIHDNVDEISQERRDGYGWYRDSPKRVLEHYARWSIEHPR